MHCARLLLFRTRSTAILQLSSRPAQERIIHEAMPLVTETILNGNEEIRSLVDRRFVVLNSRKSFIVYRS